MAVSKICSKCKADKPLSQFSPKLDGPFGRHSQCRKCRRDHWAAHAEEIAVARRKEYKNNPHKRAVLARATARYRARHKDRLAKYHKEVYRKVRIAVLQKYGGQCECCGEDRFEFLCIDHALGNGHGALDRKKHGGSCGVYRRLDKAEKEQGYRVLCHNCNSALGFYGYCPHHQTRPQIGPGKTGCMTTVSFSPAIFP